MHYLAHYRLGKNNASKWHQFGILLPDMYPGFSATVKKKLFSETHNSHTVKEITKGVYDHLAQDEIFHSHPYFLEAVEEVKRMLLNTGPQWVKHRTYVLAHVLVELMLDNVIAASSKQWAFDFHELLEKVNTIDLHQEPILYSFPNNTALFFNIFNRLKDHKPLLLLPHTETIVHALWNITSVVRRNKEFSFFDKVENLIAETEKWQFLNSNRLLEVYFDMELKLQKQK